MKAFAGLLAAGAAIAAGVAVSATARPAIAPLPQRLSETGLFVAGSTQTVRAEHIAFAPQYPLWSDGTSKRRWISLPHGTSIDASNPDAWAFPIGTRLWKEFSYRTRVETRYLERLADGTWRFAAYLWNEDGSDAELAPAAGIKLAVAGAPGGRYAVPSRDDCLACHDGAAVPVLGFGALQLSPDRDPLAPHAETARASHADLRQLAARGVIRNLPQALLDSPPRIAAPTPTARAALGYLHGNCGHCHNNTGPLAGLELSLAQQTSAPEESAEATLRSLIGHSSRFRPHGDDANQRVAPGRKDSSVLAVRLTTRNPLARMPPLGTRIVDDEGVALVERWIHVELQQP